MVKVAVIRCEKIAQVRHIPEYLDNSDVKLVGLFNLNQERAKELEKSMAARHTKAQKSF